MAKPRDDRQKDLLRPALEAIIDLGHPLVRLAREIDWGFLDGRFADVCTAGAGQPPLPTRLVAGLFILKHMHDLSDEALCARWLEDLYLPGTIRLIFFFFFFCFCFVMFTRSVTCMLGLPSRHALNAAFLVAASQAGLTSAIMDARTDQTVDACRSADLLFGRDEWGMSWIAAHREKQAAAT